ncbi:MAG: DUF3592 domain-containing protein [Paracoccaceae bacterium]|nr:DUF3592 domain-containing protein [Paracoccaceae bacterium]
MAKQIAQSPVPLWRLFLRMGGWISLIFLAPLLVLTFISAETLSIANRFDTEGRETTALLADKYYRESRDSDGDVTITYYLVLDFETRRGETMEVHRTVGKSDYNRLVQGDSMPIWYLESEPDRTEITRGQYRSGSAIAQYFALGIGLIFLTAFWYTGRNAVAAVRARRYGARESATVTGIKPTSITVGNERLYRLHWREASGRVGQSMVFRPSVLAGFASGDTITVYQGIKRAWWEGDVGPRPD